MLVIIDEDMDIHLAIVERISYPVREINVPNASTIYHFRVLETIDIIRRRPLVIDAPYREIELIRKVEEDYLTPKSLYMIDSLQKCKI